MSFFHNRKVNGQDCPKLIFLNASIKVEASFLQFGYNYSILLIKSGIFHSIGSNRTVVLTGAKGSNGITLRPGETDQHCLPDMGHFQLPVLACSFRHHQFLQTFHVWQAHFACRQAKLFSIQIKNIFACRQANVACSVLACQFRHTELVTG